MSILSPLRRNLCRGSARLAVVPAVNNPERRPERTSQVKRVLFASAHSIVDFSNGASVATLDMLEGLTAAGFECQAFCAAKLDLQSEVCLEKIVDSMDEPHQDQRSVCGSLRANLLYTRRQHVPVTIIRLDSTRHVYDRPEEVQTVVEFFQKFLDVYRPDVVLTYGGDPITAGIIGQAGRRGIPVVFALHNFAYTQSPLFAHVDYCLAASEFARRHYRDRVGLDCQALSYPIDWIRVQVEDRQPRFVTFVNPCVEKGVYPFARIAHELGRRRPDIPLLVVESRGTKKTLGACGLDLEAAGNIQVMTHTTDPRRFWGLTKIALLPSLWWENQPLVAIEAMINGIPIIASNRGGIPETVGHGGMVLPLPDRLTPATKIVPEAAEVEHWVEAIIRLWDNPALYAELSSLALQEANRWRPERLRPLYAEFFRNVRRQPGAPVLSAARPGEGEPPGEPWLHAARAEPPPPGASLSEGGGPTNPKRQRGSLSTAGSFDAPTNPKRQRGSLSTPALDLAPKTPGINPLINTVARPWEGEPSGGPRLHAARTKPRPPGTTQDHLRNIGDVDAAAGPGVNRTAPRQTNGEWMSLSIVACVSDDATASANPLASPDLARPGLPHEVITVALGLPIAEGPIRSFAERKTTINDRR